MIAEVRPNAFTSSLSGLKTPPPVIFAYGPDGYTRNNLISQVLERFLPDERDRIFGMEDYEAQEIEPSRLLSTLKTVPLGQPLKIVVVRRFELIGLSLKKDEKQKKDKSNMDKTSPIEEMLIRYFRKPSKKTLLFISSAREIRKNSRFYRSLPKDAVIVPCLGFRTNEAISFVRRELTGSGKVATGSWIEQLVEIIGTDAQRLKGEIEKIILFSGNRHTLMDEDLDIVSSNELSRDVFALLDAIISEKPDRAVTIVREVLSSGEPPLKILSVFLWHYRLVVRAQRLKKLNGQVKPSLIHHSGFVANKVIRHARKLSRTTLRSIFSHLKETDQLLKGSRLPTSDVMETLVYYLSTLGVPTRNPS